MEEGLKPKEIIIVTGCETYLIQSTERIELIRAFAEENGIEMCKELVIPDEESEGVDVSKRQAEIALQVKKDFLSVLL